jgi:beta-lactam-binding protein with PASTA domain
VSRPPHWAPGWLTIGIAGAAGFLLGVVVLVLARGVVHDEVRTVTRTRTQVVVAQPKVPNVVGLTLGEARDTLSASGYRVDATGGGFFEGPQDGDTVQRQDPQAATILPGGATVTVDVG